jgi:hypothetical protein
MKNIHSLAKKAAITTSSAGLFLFSAIQVFAAPDNSSLDPCSTGASSGPLKAACDAGNNNIGQLVGFAIGVAFVVAILIALVFLVLGGIKWITSGGDKSGVEAARNQIIAAVVGLIIVFLAFFILNLVLSFFGLTLFGLTLPTINGTK